MLNIFSFFKVCRGNDAGDCLYVTRVAPFTRNNEQKNS